MARSSAFWCFLVWASGVLAQEIVQVQTPAGTMHELARVPAGYFRMGSAEGRADEQPVHQVHLDDFYIDRFEVNNDQYAAFLNDMGRNADGKGHLLFDLRDPDAQIRYNDAGYAPIPGTEQRPVAEVSWYGARAYCTWAGMQLPTEAMWEKAARGIDGRIYPWGNSIDRSRANYGREGCCRGDDSDGFFDSAPVGSYQRGISPYGAYDMAGNVWEWVMDWYGEDYYAHSTERDPQGPDAGISRVLRGGSMSSDPYRLRTTDRGGLPPSVTYIIVGFRCAARELPATAVQSASWGQIKRRVVEDNAR
ncbi:MAG: formylglycine-generating enzyme family protein [Gemmatimonadetes bacterium]|nr:formylglycine-generating enzyme family protein [Gemmatimonadota bacterium]